MIGSPASKIDSGDRDEDVVWWMHEYDRGREARKPFKKQWDLIEKFENLSQWAAKGEDGQWDLRKGKGDEATINKVASALMTRRALLAFSTPRVKFTPKTTDDYEEVPVPLIGRDGRPKIDPETGGVEVRTVPRHIVCESLVNSIISHPMFGLSKTLDRVVKAGDMSMGVFKTGYRAEFETDPEPEGEQRVPVKDGALDLSGFARDPVSGELVLDENGRLVHTKDMPTWESWFIDWVPAHNIVVDPDCGNDEFQLRWVIEEQVRPLEDVKADPLFKIDDDFEGTGSDEYDAHAVMDDKIDGDRKWLEEKRRRVRLFHVWDMVNERYIVLADGYGKKLRDVQLPDGIYDNPYAFYRNNEQAGKGSFWQRPRFADVVPVAMQYNRAMRDLQRAMAYKNKIIVSDDLFDPTAEAAFRSDEDYAVVKVPRGFANQGGIGRHIEAWVPPPAPQALYDNVKRLEYDFYEILGMPPESMGSPKSDTATQVNKMDEYSGTRIKMDRKCLADALRVVVKKLYDSIQENMTMPRAIQILGSDGQAFPVMVDRAMIVGDFEMDIDVEDMAPVDSAVQNAQWVSAMQILAQPMGLRLVAKEVLAREYLARFNIRNEFYVKALVEMAQQAVAMEERRLAMEEAQAQLQMQMAAATAQGMTPDRSGNVPGRVPAGGAPSSPADAAAQSGGGSQSPRMQGAT